MCSRSDRRAWRADGLLAIVWRDRRVDHRNDHNAPFSRWNAIGSPQLSLTNEILAFGCCSCSSLESYILGFGTLFCGTWTIRPRIAGSSPLDANGLHHLAPLLGFIGDELSEVDRRAREGRSAQHGQPRLDLGIGKDRFDLIGERLHHIVRYCFCLK